MTDSSELPSPEKQPSGNEGLGLPMGLPSLPSAALQRIALAETAAKERYDQDKVPYFPTSPEFSFLEDSIFLSMRRILSCVQVFAVEVLNASFEEYLEYAPAELLTNPTLLQWVAENTLSQTNALWEGYGWILAAEPSTRKAQSIWRIADGTINEHPELGPWRYPPEELWARFLAQMAEPDSEMTRLNALYESTIRQVTANRIRHYQGLARARLRIDKQASPQPEEGAAKSDADLAPPTQKKALTWGDIEIRFLSDERVQIITNGRPDSRNYAEMGCEDGKSGAPTLAWRTLQLLAQNGGCIDVERFQGRNRQRVEKRIQEVRRILRVQFGIDKDPVPFIAGTGYKAVFKISTARAADT